MRKAPPISVAPVMRPPARTELHQAMRGCSGFVLWAALFSAGVNLLYLAPSLFMMQVYDRVLPTGGLTTLGLTALVLAFALATLALLDALRTRLLTRMSLRLDRTLAPALLERTLRGGAERDKGRAQILRDFDTFRQIISGPAANALFDAPWAPIYIGVCFLIHPALGALTLGGCIVLFFVALRNEAAMRRALTEAADLSPRLYAAQEADWAAAEPVRAMGMRRVLIARQLERRDALNTAQAHAAFSGTFYSAASRFLRLALQSSALGLGALLAVERQISPGALIAASILAARALTPMEQIVGAWRQLAQARSSYKIVDALFKETGPEPDHTALPAPRGALQVQGAGVRGADRPILSDITFALEAGHILGIVGPSGAGKSTLARLLVGVITPTIGAVRLDGANLRDWDSDDLGKHIGYLPQDVQLLGGTIAENIRRFMPRDDETVDQQTVAAARAAGAHDMILQLPNGYETTIGASGRGLSFGQMQRIALGRALYGQPALLVLDEPNAHLDAAGEAALIQAVKEAKDRGASVVLIAHRAGVLAAADKLLVLNNGRVENIGNAQDVARKLAEPASGAKTTFLPQRGATP